MPKVLSGRCNFEAQLSLPLKDVSSNEAGDDNQLTEGGLWHQEIQLRNTRHMQ